MMYRIHEKLTRKERKKRPEQFVEKDFESREAAEKYAEEYCKGWKKTTIKEA